MISHICAALCFLVIVSDVSPIPSVGVIPFLLSILFTTFLLFWSYDVTPSTRSRFWGFQLGAMSSRYLDYIRILHANLIEAKAASAGVPPTDSPTHVGNDSSCVDLQYRSTSCALIHSVLDHTATGTSIMTRRSKEALSIVTSRLPVLPTTLDDCVLYSGVCGALLWIQDCFTTLPSGIGSNTSTITMDFRHSPTHSIAPSFVPSFLLNRLSRDSDEMDVDFDQSQVWAVEEDSDIVSYSNMITDPPNVSSASSDSLSSGTHCTVPKESSFVSSDYVSSSTSSIRDRVFVHKEKPCGRRVFAIPFSLVEDVEEEEEERQEEDEIAKMLCDSLWRSRHLQ